ncbi:MAG TPA: hypothetical protein DEP84_09835, partial [Chloroflexi bacterium]|nr:hypothetical protein [Chloroflexota bacterium]
MNDECGLQNASAGATNVRLIIQHFWLITHHVLVACELARAHSAAGAALAVWVGARLAGAHWA